MRSMKNSTSVLIENIPNDWEAKKIKYVFDERKEFNDPIKTDILISLTHKKGVIPHSEKGDVGNKAKNDITKYKIVHPGDIVINSMNVIIGSSGLSDYFGLVSPVYYMLYKKDKKYIDRFFHYLFRSYVFQKSLVGVGNGILEHRMRVPIDKLGSHFIPIPPFQEQEIITNYLDKKTKKIDTLIEKIYKKVELIKEQRYSLINYSVIKGLSTNVEMKDSGIEWIGQIPKHWEMSRLGFLGNLSNGVSKGAEFFGEGYPFISYTDVYNNDELPTPSGLMRSNEKEWDKYSVRKGDIFFTRTSETIDDIGVSSVCLKSIEKCSFSGFLIRFRPIDKKLDTNFARYFFRSSSPLTHFTKEMNMVTRSSLSQGLLKSCPVVIPPLSEQKKIASYLSKKIDKLDKTIFLETKKIDLLKEYRQSLISSIVTGKVRISEDML